MPGQPVLHLGGGFIGKGYRRNPRRRYAALLDQIGDTADQGAGFAGSRPGGDGNGRVSGADSLPLLRIQAVGQL